MADATEGALIQVGRIATENRDRAVAEFDRGWRLGNGQLKGSNLVQTVLQGPESGDKQTAAGMTDALFRRRVLFGPIELQRTTGGINVVDALELKANVVGGATRAGVFMGTVRRWLDAVKKGEDAAAPAAAAAAAISGSGVNGTGIQLPDSVPLPGGSNPIGGAIDKLGAAEKVASNLKLVGLGIAAVLGVLVVGWFSTVLGFFRRAKGGQG